jgi:pimeloyl-ACP methyl ester carboxylesterase
MSDPRQPLIELGGPADGPLLHIAPANGFVPQTYMPLLRPLMSHFRVVSLPPRALWTDQPPPELTPANDWQEVADDLLAGIEQYGLRDMIAVGHSFGCVATMLSAMAKPEYFRAFIMLDPTIFPQAEIEAMRAARAQGEGSAHPLAQGAKRRRRQFDSKQAAYERFSGRSIFRAWPDETVRLYVEHGLKPDPTADNPEAVTLAWPPEWEAYYFSTCYTDQWERLPELRGLLPLLIASGGTSDIFTDECVQRAQGMLPDATLTVVPDHGHLFPQEVPEDTARIMQEWMRTQGILT